MKNKIIATCIYLIALLTIVSEPISASQMTNGAFREYFETDEKRLKIRGVGLFRYMVFLRVYAGVLYLPDNAPSETALSDVPKRLEVEYFQDIRGEDFGSATRKLIARNVDSQTFEKLERRIDLQSAFYEDVEPGDRYALTNIPGKGTELSLNGVPKGTIEGADFAAALFAIWLGPDPMDESFKAQLLGLK